MTIDEKSMEKLMYCEREVNRLAGWLKKNAPDTIDNAGKKNPEGPVDVAIRLLGNWYKQ